VCAPFSQKYHRNIQIVGENDASKLTATFSSTTWADEFSVPFRERFRLNVATSENGKIGEN